VVVAGAGAREPPRSSPGGELGRRRPGVDELGARGGVGRQRGVGELAVVTDPGSGLVPAKKTPLL
jgi:hypothetical protein